MCRAAVGLSFLALMFVRQQRRCDAAGSHGPCAPADRAAACLSAVPSGNAVDGHHDGRRPQQPPNGVDAFTRLTFAGSGRGKKNKNLGPMLAAGAAVMAGTLMPIAFGALFALAGKAIVTSLMAITISGLLGLKALFGKHESSGHVKAYSAAAPSPHYSGAQFERDAAVYGVQAETVKAHGPAAGLSGHYGGDRHGAGSGRPVYFAGEHDDGTTAENDGYAT